MLQTFIINPDELRTIVADTVNACLADWQPAQPAPHPTGYITRAQVCKLLHITLPTVHAWAKEGKLTAYHIGGRTLFKESEVLAEIKPVKYSLT